MTTLRNQRGQGLAEYSLIIAIISIGSLAVMTLLQGDILFIFNTLRAAF
jgi:Flp pilus assembly pilin Flp